MGDHMAIGFAGAEHAGWKFRAVGRVREALRLEAEPAIPAIGPARRFGVEEGAVIELDARLGRQKLHRKVASRRGKPRREPRLSASLPSQDEGVVIGAFASDRARATEVVSGARHGSGMLGDQVARNRKIFFSRNHEPVIAYIAAA